MARICQCSFPQPGEWVKGKVIGSGSHGSVHLAMNKASGSLFVVKSANSDADVHSLENEENILGSLDSPYIVQCLGKSMSKGSNGERKLGIFLEYMAGGSLSEVAEKFGGALDQEVICLYTREILCGLKYLHERGIVHCDLKCKNVLLGPSGNVKLADFGCAKRLKLMEDQENRANSAHSRQSNWGTPLWMAPEVLRNDGLHFASDIWSLGCTVIEMATGRPPWGDKVSSNPMAAVLKIACGSEKPRFPSHFSEEGLDFLSRCLERNPGRRWTVVELLNHPFISGNSTKKCINSPSSVFDIGMSEKDYDSDASETPSEDELPYRNPLSTKRMRMGRSLQAESDSDLSQQDWITVRSG